LACLRGDGGDGRGMAEACEWQSGYTCCVETAIESERRPTWGWEGVAGVIGQRPSETAIASERWPSVEWKGNVERRAGRNQTDIGEG